MHGDLRYLILPKYHFDAAALIFAHFPPENRKEIHQKIIESLKPGGVMILQGFTKEQLNQKSGGPNSADMLFDRQMLMEDFAQLTDLQIEEVTENLDEGKGHRGVSKLIQLKGKKPAQDLFGHNPTTTQNN